MRRSVGLQQLALPLNTATIIEFLRPNADSGDNFTVTINKDGVVSISQYDDADIGQPQPTDQEIIDTGNSPEFLSHEDEHGKDPIKTRRKGLRDLRETPEERVRIAVLADITGKPKEQIRKAYSDAIEAGEGD